MSRTQIYLGIASVWGVVILAETVFGFILIPHFDSATVVVVPPPPPPVVVRLAATTVPENTPAAEIGTLSVDAPGEYSFSVSDDRFEVVGQTLKLKSGKQVDFEAAATIPITVTASTSDRDPTDGKFTIAVEDRNDAPTAIDLNVRAVDDKSPGAVVGTVRVSDPDQGDAFELGVSDDRFVVVNDQLKLRAGTEIDYEKESSITLLVTATDKAGEKIDQQFTVAVNRVGSTPSVTPAVAPPIAAMAPTALKLPFITWGGDVATFYANGDLKTQPGSIYDGLKLQIELANGDDFAAQVKDYKAGKSHFLRGTFSMLGEVAEELNADPSNQAVVFMQLTWSAGDHMVAREGLKTLTDLKGKRVAIQKSGPHIGMLDDSLWAAGLTWKDIEPVWVDALTGENSPAESFRNDPTVAACTVISPDMAGLTGDFDLTAVGSGQNDTIRGAHVLNSTAWMSRSICDVYAVRKQFLDENRDVVEKFTAGYLKACEEVMDLKKSQPSPQYTKVLELAQKILTPAVLPTSEDADGLLSDCAMVGLPGNKTFFTRANNLAGFTAKQQKVLDLAVKLGFAKGKQPFRQPDFDYDELKRLGRIRANPDDDPLATTLTIPEEGETIYSFEINFTAAATVFPVAMYKAQFQRAAELSSLFGRGAILIRGHSDVGLGYLINPLLQEGYIVRDTSTKPYSYYILENGKRGKLIDLEDRQQIVDLVRNNKFPTAESDPNKPLDEAATLSQDRADQVKKDLLAYAQANFLRLNEDQFRAIGVGATQPAVPSPRDAVQMAKNWRVEFRLIRISPEATSAEGFDF